MPDDHDHDDLPEGEARLVLREEGVTTVIQGDAETVRHRHEQELADALDMTVEEMKTATDDYPMPEFGEGLVPADEGHESDEHSTRRTNATAIDSRS